MVILVMIFEGFAAHALRNKSASDVIPVSTPGGLICTHIAASICGEFSAIASAVLTITSTVGVVVR